MTLATRCPACDTVFRVTAEQLVAFDGWVRCGRCGEAFDAAAARFEVGEGPGEDAAMRTTGVNASASTASPPAGRRPGAGVAPGGDPPVRSSSAAVAQPRPGDVSTGDRSPVGPPAAPSAAGLRATHPSIGAMPSGAGPRGGGEPRSAAASAAADGSAPGRPAGGPPDALPSSAVSIAAEPAGAASAGTASTAVSSRTDPAIPAAIVSTGPVPDAAPPSAPLDVSSFVRRAERQARRPSTGTRFAVGLLTGLLLVAAALAALHRVRDDVAARWPAARPWLAALCDMAGCRIAPLRKLTDLTVESSALDPAPGGSGRLRLSVVVRNRGALPVAAPWVALSFTGRDGRTLAHRSLAPADFAPPPPAELAPGRDATLTIDLPAVAPTASGYAVELFYP